MNILYVGFYELPDKDAAANRVVNNVKALQNAGHKVIFIDEKKDGVSQNILYNKSYMGNADVWSTLRPVSVIQYIEKMISISKIISVVKQYERINVIIVYNYPALALDKLKRYCKKRQIKLISDCTEWYSGKEYSFPKSIFSAMDSYLRMCVIQKKLDGIICISNYLENYYKDQNTINIPPLVDANSPLWNQKTYKWSANKLNLIYAGNPGKSKELILPILQSIEKSINKDNIVFRIVGITKEQFTKLYPGNETLLKNIKKSVFFLGRLSHSETVKMITSSDYMIFMRPQNRVSMAGFSTKFVEAISCGTSVITTDTGDLKSIIKSTGAGIIVNSTRDLTNYLNNDLNFLKEKAIIKDKSLFSYEKYVQIFDAWITK